MKSIFGGSTSTEDENAKAASNFYTTAVQQQQTVFGQQQDLFSSINSTIKELVSGTFSAFGYGADEQSDLVSSIMSGDAQATANALTATQLKMTQLNGGGTGTTTGAEEQIQADASATLAQNTSKDLLAEKIGGYQQGTTNAQTGVADTLNEAEQLDPTKYSSAVNSAGGVANDAAKIQQTAADNNMLSKALNGAIAGGEAAAMGGLGGIATQAGPAGAGIGGMFKAGAGAALSSAAAPVAKAVA